MASEGGTAGHLTVSTQKLPPPPPGGAKRGSPSTRTSIGTSPAAKSSPSSVSKLPPPPPKNADSAQQQQKTTQGRGDRSYSEGGENIKGTRRSSVELAKQIPPPPPKPANTTQDKPNVPNMKQLSKVSEALNEISIAPVEKRTTSSEDRPKPTLQIQRFKQANIPMRVIPLKKTRKPRNCVDIPPRNFCQKEDAASRYSGQGSSPSSERRQSATSSTASPTNTPVSSRVADPQRRHHRSSGVSIEGTVSSDGVASGYDDGQAATPGYYSKGETQQHCNEDRDHRSLSDSQTRRNPSHSKKKAPVNQESHSDKRHHSSENHEPVREDVERVEREERLKRLSQQKKKLSYMTPKPQTSKGNREASTPNERNNTNKGFDVLEGYDDDGAFDEEEHAPSGRHAKPSSPQQVDSHKTRISRPHRATLVVPPITEDEEDEPQLQTGKKSNSSNYGDNQYDRGPGGRGKSPNAELLKSVKAQAPASHSAKSRPPTVATPRQAKVVKPVFFDEDEEGESD